VAKMNRKVSAANGYRQLDACVLLLELTVFGTRACCKTYCSCTPQNQGQRALGTLPITMCKCTCISPRHQHCVCSVLRWLMLTVTDVVVQPAFTLAMASPPWSSHNSLLLMLGVLVALLFWLPARTLFQCVLELVPVHRTSFLWPQV
jgi:hypothetical protein